MYKKYFKRIIDLIISSCAIIALSPLLLILAFLGVIFMRGNPFFVQERPGKNEKIFKLVKFRTMNNQKDKRGVLLPDEIRLNSYGKFLRSTSLDELPELINIVKGDMAIVGPRPLLVRYLPYYKESEKARHDVRPGLTGLAQINGRNNLGWDERLKLDVIYVDKITFLYDVSIILKTIIKVIRRSNVLSGSEMRLKDLDEERENRS